MGRKRVAIVIIGAAVLVAGACGGDSEQGQEDRAETSTTSSVPAETTETTETTGTTTTVTTTTVTTTTVTVPGVGERPAGPPRTSEELVFFRSPTGNIGCAMEPTYVRCDISGTDWERPPKPPDCELDYGSGLSLGVDDGADFTCAGDSVFGDGEVLPYGESISAGEMNCTSTETAMVCWSSASGRGFTLSRERYVIT